MAVLHPQECYLLEKFISPEHYAATRDAIIAYIDAHEAAFARYLREMPLNTRKLPLWQQADMVWGNRVLPNIRSARERYIKAYILRTHNDIEAFNIGHTMSNISRGITECWDGWMTQDEIEIISELEGLASKLDGRLSTTLDATWREGTLTYNDFTLKYKSELPSQLPRYELDASVRIELGESPNETGIYLPDIDFAPARFIPADYGQAASGLQGTKRCDWVDPATGERDYSWKESEWAKTGWTLIRRIEDEYIDVPYGGFFPEGKPEELYNWPKQEQLLLQEKMVRITRWDGDVAPFAGRWATTVNGSTQYLQTREEQVLPLFEDRHGKKYRACWSLLERDDKGSVFVMPDDK